MRRLYISEDKKFLAIHDEGTKIVLMNLVGEVSDEWDAPRKKMVKVKEVEEDESDDEESEDESEDEDGEEDTDEEEDEPEPESKGGYKCGKCGGRGHNAKTCKEGASNLSDEDMDLKAQIDELKGEGMNSAQIAEQLEIPMNKVIKLWL